MPFFTFADLFAGIGGFRLAAEQLGGKCCFTSEIDRNALKVYSLNFEETEPVDMTKVDFTQVPKVDIIMAGFPCQPFSRAGFKRGFEDIRGTLFFELIRYILAHTPDYLLLENVADLKTHDKGQTLATMVECLRELNYTVDYKVLCTKDFGLPQNRARMFIIGHRTPYDFEWPRPRPLLFTMSNVLKGQCNREIGYTLRVGGYNSPINDRHNWNGYWVDEKEHRLTWDEAKMMQGFPITFKLPEGMSEHIGLKLLGNSVSVPVVEALLQQLLFLKNI